MNQATATLRNLRQSPRKVRLVADLIRGKKIAVAQNSLMFANKRSSKPMQTLLASALSNAKSLNLDPETLIVKTITVNGGVTLMRRQPMSRGRAFPLRKRTSHITIVLEEKAVKATKPKTKK